MARLLLNALVLPSLVHADVYLHSPRGSNNKLNEVSNNARNQARLFDSQNNAAGVSAAADLRQGMGMGPLYVGLSGGTHLPQCCCWQSRTGCSLACASEPNLPPPPAGIPGRRQLRSRML
eukprot:scaffold97154_cov32-Tisochrysis_lutea.AAC.1